MKHLTSVYESTKKVCIWMVELRKFEPHMEYVKNHLLYLFESWNRKKRLTWDVFEERSNVGAVELVYNLEMQCLVAYHHVCYSMYSIRTLHGRLLHWKGYEETNYPANTNLCYPVS